MIRKLYKLVILMAIMFILTSCVGKREIDDLAMVMGVGLDLVENKNGEEEVKVTAQIARPADARGQTGAPSGQTGEPIWSISATDKSIFGAIRKLENLSSRRIFWAHSYVIVINEDLAKNGIKDIIDFFIRNPELRMRTWVTVTPDDASELVSSLTGLEVIPGQSIEGLFKYSDITRAAPRSQMIDLHAAYLSDATQPYVARLKLETNELSNQTPEQGEMYKNVTHAGTGVFKDDKLVGTLSAKETRSLLLFVENIKSGVSIIPCAENEEDVTTFELVHEELKVIPDYKEGTPEFTLKVKTTGKLVETDCAIGFDDDQKIKELESNIEEKFKKDINKVLDKIQQEYGVDILEAGNSFNNKLPSKWKEMRVNWDDHFQDATFHVDITAEIKSGALLIEPTESNKRADE
ncbi:Ger(x)C family spore germination protein [Aquibacillus sediminis]|uniref:Ger(x)C family spore germination protein n=1 Tax=Aquibacillus sediminis TaxID=2574734 RepID=UPI0011088490|nr:Ger(x)C family spore germination protein [Aquibacillus sediminis]